jgi:hypothetical protein
LIPENLLRASDGTGVSSVLRKSSLALKKAAVDSQSHERQKPNESHRNERQHRASLFTDELDATSIRQLSAPSQNGFSHDHYRVRNSQVVKKKPH